MGMGWGGLEGDLKLVSRDTCHWSRMLQAVSKLALNTAGNGAASPFSPFQCPTALPMKLFLPRSHPTLPSSNWKLFLLIPALDPLSKAPLQVPCSPFRTPPPFPTI